MMPARLLKNANKMINRCKYVYSHGMSNDVDFTSEDIEVLELLVRYCLQL